MCYLIILEMRSRQTKRKIHSNSAYIIEKSIKNKQNTFELECQYIVEKGLGEGTYGYCQKVRKSLENQKLTQPTEIMRQGDGKFFCIKIFYLEHSKTIDQKMSLARKNMERRQNGEIINDQNHFYLGSNLIVKQEHQTEKKYKEQIDNYQNEKEIMGYIYNNIFETNHKNNQNEKRQKVQYFVEMIDSWEVPYEDNTIKKQAFILMEYCSLGDLAQFKKRIEENKEKLDSPQILYFVKEILQGLSLLEAHKIIHRDIKLPNIFLNEDFQIKIADFGISYRCQEQKKQQSNQQYLKMGTPRYMAPEVKQFNGMDLNERKKMKKYDCKIDVFSLGIVIYKLMFGVQPKRYGQKKEIKHDKEEDNGQDKPKQKNKQIYYDEDKDVDKKLKTLQKLQPSEGNNVEEQLLKELTREALQYDPEKRKSASQLLNLLKQKCSWAKEPFYYNKKTEIVNGLRQKLKTKFKVIVTDVFHVKNIGHMFLLSNGNIHILIKKQDKLIHQWIELRRQLIIQFQKFMEQCTKSKQILSQKKYDELKVKIEQLMGSESKLKLKIQLYFSFLRCHPLIEASNRVKFSPQYEDHKLQTNVSIDNINISAKTVLLILSNNVIQCFYGPQQQSNIKEGNLKYDSSISINEHTRNRQLIHVKYFPEVEEKWLRISQLKQKENQKILEYIRRIHFMIKINLKPQKINQGSTES